MNAPLPGGRLKECVMAEVELQLKPVEGGKRASLETASRFHNHSHGVLFPRCNETGRDAVVLGAVVNVCIGSHQLARLRCNWPRTWRHHLNGVTRQASGGWARPNGFLWQALVWEIG